MILRCRYDIYCVSHDSICIVIQYCDFIVIRCSKHIAHNMSTAERQERKEMETNRYLESNINIFQKYYEATVHVTPITNDTEDNEQYQFSVILASIYLHSL